MMVSEVLTTGHIRTRRAFVRGVSDTSPSTRYFASLRRGPFAASGARFSCSSCRAERSNPWLGIARSKMEFFVAFAPRNEWKSNRATTYNGVITGLVPVIHVLALLAQKRRGWPGQARP